MSFGVLVEPTGMPSPKVRANQMQDLVLAFHNFSCKVQIGPCLYMRTLYTGRRGSKELGKESNRQEGEQQAAKKLPSGRESVGITHM